MLVQMTDIRSAIPALPPATGPTAGRGGRGVAPAPITDEPPKGTDSQEYLKKEQKELLEVIRERTARRDENDARRKKENPRKPYTLQARQSVTSLQLSPDEKYVIATFNDGPANAKNTIVPNYVTESAYTEDIPGRANVGDTQGRTRIAAIDVATGEVKWVEHGQKLAPPATTAAQRTETTRPPTPQERDVRLFEPVWSEDGSKAVILARASDNKDRWILGLDPSTGK